VDIRFWKVKKKSKENALNSDATLRGKIILKILCFYIKSVAKFAPYNKRVRH